MWRDAARAARRLPIAPLVLAAWLSGAAPALGANPLSVTIVGQVDAAAYPAVGVTLSVVDATTGRPVTALTPSNLAVSDPLGPATVTDVSATSAVIPSAYVLELDTSGSMLDQAAPGQTYMDRAKNLARAFVAGLGPDDLVRVITFDVSPSTRTGWLKQGDPSLTAAIDAVAAETQPTHVSAGLVAATHVADGRPAGFERRAVVLITDADPADKDSNLTVGAMRKQLGVPAFVIGLRPASQVGPDLGRLLSDIATYTGGAYLPAGTRPDPATLFQLAWASTQSAWTVHFRTDVAPDGASHQLTLAVTDASQHTGQAALTYRAGNLFSVTSLGVRGLANGDDVTADRTVTFTTAGKSWSDARIDLFVDCNPGTCDPLLSADNGPLSWRLAVGPMAQGTHDVIARLTVRDSQNHQFRDQVRIAFTRSGTTLNYEADILLGGIALVAMGAVFTATRRRRTAGRQEGGQ